MSKIHILVMSLIALAACGDDGARHTCGAGTTVSGGECIAVDAGNNPNMTTCGSGTHLEGDTCVADPAGGGTAPTIAAIMPTHAGISGLTPDGGGVFFEITGAGFLDPKAGAVTVTFGSVQAASVVMDDNTIDGIIPGNTVITAPVTVSDANGSAMIAFTYDALLAAGAHGQPGDLYVIDPTNGFDLDLGAITVDDGTGSAAGIGVTGLAFDGSALYAATTGVNGPAELVTSIPRELIKVDLQTGVTTVVGAFADASQTPIQVSDIEDVNGTLYAAGFSGNETGDGGAAAFFGTVDTTTGTVTYIAALPSDSGGGMTTDGSGAMWYSGDGTVNQPLYSLDLATGSGSAALTLDGSTGNNPPIAAMANENGTLYAVVDTAQDGDTTDPSLLGSIDPTTGHLTIVGPIPSAIDAIVAPPASLVLARMAGQPFHRTTATHVTARCAPLHAVPRTTGSHVTITTCDGQTSSVTLGGRYQLVTNRRGNVKLVDRTTHRTVLRNVTSLR